MAGKTRDLENTLRQAVLLSHNNVLLPESLRLVGYLERKKLAQVAKHLHEVEREHIENIPNLHAL